MKLSIKTKNVSETSGDADINYLATWEWMEDGDEGPYGTGATEDDAVFSLINHSVDDKICDGEPQDELVNMAYALWTEKKRTAKIEKALQNFLNGVETGAVSTDVHDQEFQWAVNQGQKALENK
jgi:hypothetical protein